MALSWSPVTSLSCTTCLSPYAKPQGNTIYTITARYNNDLCASNESVSVRISRPRNVYIPTAFTPNGDGKNDVFTAYGGKGVVKINTFRVYDRWGELLYEATNIPTGSETIGWNGTFNGKAMIPDAYVYYMQVEFLDGKVFDYKGDVSIIR
jgi:gliding motility-associated-like protein